MLPLTQRMALGLCRSERIRANRGLALARRSAVAERAGPVLLLAGKLRFRSSCLFLLHLARGLMDAGESVRILCSRMEIEEEARRLGVPWHEWFQLPGAWRGVFSDRPLRQMVEDWGVRVIHAYGPRLGVLGGRLLRAGRLPAVYTPEAFRFDRIAVSRLQAYARRVIVSDEGLRETCVNDARVPKEKVALVPQGVDLDRTPLSLPRVGSGSRPVIGSMGPLVVENGIEVFLQSARQLLDEGARVRFLVAGDGPDERRLRTICSDLNLNAYVTFITRMTNALAVLDCMDILVRPSVMGGLGFIMLQAMAAGKAVVATDVGGAYSLLEDGVCGRLVPKRNSEALAAVLEDLLSNPAQTQQFGRNAREFVGDRFKLQTTVERTLGIYAQALSGK